MFWHGCNYPWSTDGTTVFYGLDFGANIWGSHLGVSTRRTAVAGDFARMASLGFTVARWFVFGDGRSGILYDDRGLPTGPDSHLFTDLDAALEIARDAGIRLDLVLLDHRWMFEGVKQTIADPATGALFEARLPDGRSNVLHSKIGRESLLRGVFEPLLRRYGTSGERADLASQIFAVEFMNEPDFVVEEWERDLSSRVSRPLPFHVLADLVTRLSALVHAHTSALTTIGCARLHNLWAWDDPALELDFLQLHSYPDLKHPERDADVFGQADLDAGRAQARRARRVSRRRRAPAPRGRNAAGHDARRVSRIRRGRGLFGRLAVELQRHGRLRDASRAAAARVRETACGPREPAVPGEVRLRRSG